MHMDSHSYTVTIVCLCELSNIWTTALLQYWSFTRQYLTAWLLCISARFHTDKLSHYILLCFLTELQTKPVLLSLFQSVTDWASLTRFTVFLKTEEDLCDLALNVHRIVLFCPHQGRGGVTQAEVVSALEKEKDTRSSPTQKQDLAQQCWFRINVWEWS